MWEFTLRLRKNKPIRAVFVIIVLQLPPVNTRWCYHIPGSSSPVDCMKTDQKNKFLQIILSGALLSALVLSGIVSYFLGMQSASNPNTPSLFTVSLTNSIVLLLIIALVYFLMNKKKSTSEQHVDLLTGFMTRHAFAEVFEHAMLDAKRSLEPLSVIIVDIDHFRHVNQQYGHNIGDDLLKMLSRTIQSVLRASDITCRWEGDQILIILKDCSSRDSNRIAEKLLNKIRQEKLERSNLKIGITVSIGVAQMISNDDIDSLVDRAETGVHSARDNGRDTFATGYDWLLIDYSCDPIF